MLADDLAESVANGSSRHFHWPVAEVISSAPETLGDGSVADPISSTEQIPIP